MPFHSITLVFSIFTPPPLIPDNELSNEWPLKAYIFAKMTTFIFIILFAHLPMAKL